MCLVRDDARVRVRLVEASMEGSTVLVTRPYIPALRAAAKLRSDRMWTLSIAAPGLDRPILLQAFMHSASREVLGVRAELRYQGARPRLCHVENRLRMVFNRRSALRMRPEGADPVAVHILRDGVPLPRLALRYDLSVLGAGVMLREDLSHELDGGDTVTLSMVLRGDKPSLIPVKVVHNAVLTHSLMPVERSWRPTRLGLDFALAQATDPRAAANIGTFVMRCQLAQERAHHRRGEPQGEE